MSSITTRAGKGAPLTNAELDANFNNLNAGKAELAGAAFTGDISVAVGKSISGIGAGFSNMVALTSGTSIAWPTGVKRLKYIVIAGGGGGGKTAATAGHQGAGGGSGGVSVGFLNYVDGINTLNYAIGAGGAALGAGGTTLLTYNAVSTTCTGGAGGTAAGNGGAGGTATGGTLNFSGARGFGGGVNAATAAFSGEGADTPLGYGLGGITLRAAAGAVGGDATGYGAGGSGGMNGSAATARAGGVGTQGMIILEY